MTLNYNKGLGNKDTPGPVHFFHGKGFEKCIKPVICALFAPLFHKKVHRHCASPDFCKSKNIPDQIKELSPFKTAPLKPD